MGLSTDGANVMVGKNNRVAAKLRQSNDKLLNLQCLPPPSTGLQKRIKDGKGFDHIRRTSKVIFDVTRQGMTHLPRRVSSLLASIVV